jgi:hypothetical protein
VTGGLVLGGGGGVASGSTVEMWAPNGSTDDERTIIGV